jgi:hypothetical protein
MMLWLDIIRNRSTIAQDTNIDEMYPNPNPFEKDEKRGKPNP